MDYRNVEGLTPKTSKTRSLGISAFIKDQLDAIPEDGAISVAELATSVHEKFPHIKKNQSYVRVNMVLQRDGYKDVFVRLENKEHKTFIARATTEAEA